MTEKFPTTIKTVVIQPNDPFAAISPREAGQTAAASTPTPPSLIFLDQSAAAELLGLSPRTLERFRLDGSGPQFRKFGRRVRYALSDIEAWADAQKRSSTSQSGDADRGRHVS